MTTEWGALAGIFPVDERLTDWFTKRHDASKRKETSYCRRITSSEIKFVVFLACFIYCVLFWRNIRCSTELQYCTQTNPHLKNTLCFLFFKKFLGFFLLVNALVSYWWHSFFWEWNCCFQIFTWKPALSWCECTIRKGIVWSFVTTAFKPIRSRCQMSLSYLL